MPAERLASQNRWSKGSVARRHAARASRAGRRPPRTSVVPSSCWSTPPRTCSSRRARLRPRQQRALGEDLGVQRACGDGGHRHEPGPGGASGRRIEDVVADGPVRVAPCAGVDARRRDAAAVDLQPVDVTLAPDAVDADLPSPAADREVAAAPDGVRDAGRHEGRRAVGGDALREAAGIERHARGRQTRPSRSTLGWRARQPSAGRAARRGGAAASRRGEVGPRRRAAGGCRRGPSRRRARGSARRRAGPPARARRGGGTPGPAGGRRG